MGWGRNKSCKGFIYFCIPGEVGGDSHANTKYFFGGLTLVTGDILDEKLPDQLL